MVVFFVGLLWYLVWDEKYLKGCKKGDIFIWVECFGVVIKYVIYLVCNECGLIIILMYY